MHDTAPSSVLRVRVPVFNPAQNPNQVSKLRLINPGTVDAQVEIVGIDDDGESPGETVEVTVAAGRARTLSAKELEENEADSGDFVGALGDGQGKWQLTITSSQPIFVMGLREAPTTRMGACGRALRVVAGAPLVPVACDGPLRSLDVPRYDFASAPCEEHSGDH